MTTQEIIQGDCLIEMQKIPDKSVDMILCDLPYGTTACKWDTIIPFEPLWAQYKRIIKDNGAIVLTASQPFTSALVMSNPDMFKYNWTWVKTRNSNPFLAKTQPLRMTEDIVIFGKSKIKYIPQMEGGCVYQINRFSGGRIASDTKSNKPNRETSEKITHRYPKNVIYIPNKNVEAGLHPTQKPVALFEYLIKTYTNEGDLVLDNCAGSGTTGVAAINTKRNFILIEKEPEYIAIIKKRLEQQTLL